MTGMYIKKQRTTYTTSTGVHTVQFFADASAERWLFVGGTTILAQRRLDGVVSSLETVRRIVSEANSGKRTLMHTSRPPKSNASLVL